MQVYVVMQFQESHDQATGSRILSDPSVFGIFSDRELAQQHVREPMYDYILTMTLDTPGIM